MSAKVLPVYAAPVEGHALGDLGARCIGVGKAASAAGLAVLLRDQRPEFVLLFGVCGAYPERHRDGPPPVRPGLLCLVGDDVLGDEGVLLAEGFRDLAALELGEVGPFPADPARCAWAAAVLGAVPVVRGATVSTCSGTDAASAALAARTRADLETMEGAAVALVCRAFGVPWLQVRCASNWTGDRERGEWQLEAAAARVQAAVRRLLAAR